MVSSCKGVGIFGDGGGGGFSVMGLLHWSSRSRERRES